MSDRKKFAPKNPKNGTTKIKQALDKQGKGDLCPPCLSQGKVKPPKAFTTIGDVIKEQKRLYKLVFTGDLALSDMTKLIYALQQIIQGIKAKSEIDALEDAYIKQWQGVRIVAPEGEAIPDEMQKAIEGVIVDE
ncbi:MAG: hypothetical protein MI685_09495 [Chlorobiales bacterium]|nr:hypothetical protein [Chlorobiales bacterium]